MGSFLNVLKIENLRFPNGTMSSPTHSRILRKLCKTKPRFYQVRWLAKKIIKFNLGKKIKNEKIPGPLNITALTGEFASE